jgi:hypothetical protein
VKEQTSTYLEKSRDLLGRADTMMGAGLTDDAGRTAYRADYETGPGSHMSEESAREAIQTARQLVECVMGLLAKPTDTGSHTRTRSLPMKTPARADGLSRFAPPDATAGTSTARR